MRKARIAARLRALALGPVPRLILRQTWWLLVALLSLPFALVAMAAGKVVRQWSRWRNASS
jgi:hypothetical protein